MKNIDAKTGLAVVGFISLVAAGMWLAVYATRFVPTVVNRAGSAAVYVGSLFTSTSTPGLSVVSTPIASTTISFGDASATLTTIKKIAPAYSAPVFYGLPDLAVNISAIGYLTEASADSFVASSTVPAGSRPAVKFTIKNIGTNWTGTWRFSATIPTMNEYIYQSQPQQSLAPGDSVDYTLGFDRANTGANQLIIIVANFDRAVSDSNANNNSASATVTIL